MVQWFFLSIGIHTGTCIYIAWALLTLEEAIDTCMYITYSIGLNIEMCPHLGEPLSVHFV